MAVKLRKPIEVTEGDPSSEVQRPIRLNPLVVSGVVIRKADLIEALRIYVPNLADLEAVEGGERFVLTLAGGPKSNISD